MGAASAFFGGRSRSPPPAPQQKNEMFADLTRIKVDWERRRWLLARFSRLGPGISCGNGFGPNSGQTVKGRRVGSARGRFPHFGSTSHVGMASTQFGSNMEGFARARFVMWTLLQIGGSSGPVGQGGPPPGHFSRVLPPPGRLVSLCGLLSKLRQHCPNTALKSALVNWGKLWPFGPMFARGGRGSNLDWERVRWLLGRVPRLGPGISCGADLGPKMSGSPPLRARISCGDGFGAHLGSTSLCGLLRKTGAFSGPAGQEGRPLPKPFCSGVFVWGKLVSSYGS